MKQYKRVLLWGLGIVAFIVLAGTYRTYSDNLRFGKGYIECFKGGDAGIECWTKYLDSGQGDNYARASAFSFRGSLYEDRKDYDLAIADYDNAFSLQPDDVTYLRHGAFALRQKGDCAATIKAYDQVIYRDATHSSDFGARGDAYMCQHDVDHAIANYNEAIRLNPISGYQYERRSKAWRAKGDNDKAMSDLDSSTRLAGRTNEAICKDVKYVMLSCWGYLGAWSPL